MLQVEICLPLFEIISPVTEYAIQYGEVDCAVDVEPDGEGWAVIAAYAYDLTRHRMTLLRPESELARIITEHARLRCTERIEEEIANFDDWPRGRSDYEEHGLSRAQLGL